MDFSNRRNRLKIGAVIAVMVVVVLIVCQTRSSEPEYQGYRLSRWVSNYGASGGTEAAFERSQRAIVAVRAMGTNALPWMVDAIGREPFGWQWHSRSIQAHGPTWLRNPLLFLSGQTDRERNSAVAMKAFEILGPEAAPAVSQLDRLVRRTNSPNTSTRALIALGYIGAPAVASVGHLLAESRYSGTWAMRVCLENLGTNVAGTVPILLEQLAATPSIAAQRHVLTLGKISMAADQFVPSLAQALSHPDQTVRRLAAEGLAGFGTFARSALPALTNALQDVDPQVSQGAAAAIQAITMESPR